MPGNAEAVQRALMRALLDRIGREHLLLKGGTALMFGYNIPRTSGDLDFDANRPVRGLVKKMQEVEVPDVTIVGIDTTKDTSTTQRYRLRYLVDGSDEEQKLKVEISYRQPFDEKDVMVIDGIRFASLPRIIDQKLRAAFDGKDRRTASRDLFDLDFLASTYPEAFTRDLAKRLAQFTEDPSTLYSSYEQAFEKEDLGLSVDQVEELVLRLAENSRQILQRLAERPGKTNIFYLCKFAEIEHEVPAESSAVVLLETAGGHKKSGDEYVVDMMLVPTNEDQQERTLDLLTVLAIDLNSAEASAALARAGVIERGPDGEFVRTHGKKKGNGGRT